jgi:transcription termination/antitermination protein NusA
MSDVRMEAQSNRASQLEDKRVALGVSDEVAAIHGLTAQNLIALGKNGIKSLDDLADLANDELLEIVGLGHMSRETANGIIMAARAHWFE